MKKRICLLLFVMIALFSCKEKYPNLEDGLYAEIETEKGNILLALEFQKTPITVANFVTLAEGKNEFVSEQYKGKPFYDGLKFHRVINDFMIQGGDPLGTASGDIGYEFKDEITTLIFDKGGILAMANSGPETNTSQFFITHKATPDLNGNYTIFGHVVGNEMDVVNAIKQDDVIQGIKIIRKGEAAKKFNAVKVFHDFFTTYSQQYRPAIETKIAYFKNIKAQCIKTKTGLEFKILSKGNGLKPKTGSEIYIDYAGFLEDGTLFDTSIASVAKTFGKFDQRRADANQYAPIPFQAGAKVGMIPGFIEGLENMEYGDKAIIFIPSYLGYGKQGANGVIPPNANIIFEVELLEKMPTQ